MLMERAFSPYLFCCLLPELLRDHKTQGPKTRWSVASPPSAPELLRDLNARGLIAAARGIAPSALELLRDHMTQGPKARSISAWGNAPGRARNNKSRAESPLHNSLETSSPALPGPAYAEYCDHWTASEVRIHIHAVYWWRFLSGAFQADSRAVSRYGTFAAPGRNRKT
jgi:hypothetical protein